MEIWRETDEAGSMECHRDKSEKSWTKNGTNNRIKILSSFHVFTYYVFMYIIIIYHYDIIDGVHISRTAIEREVHWYEQ